MATKEPTEAEKAEEAAKASQKSINESVDAWRVMQGLPPIDRSKEARKA